MYEKIDSMLDATNEKANLVITGDFNAVVGKGKVEDIVGEFGLEKRNTIGERLVHFCKDI